MTTFTLKNDSSKVDPVFLSDGSVSPAGTLPYSLELHPEYLTSNNDSFTFVDALVGRVSEVIALLNVFSDSTLSFDGLSENYDGKSWKTFTSAEGFIDGGVVGTIPANNGSGNISLTNIYVNVSGLWIELSGSFGGTTALGLTSASITGIKIGYENTPPQGETNEYRIAGTLALSANGFWSGSLQSLSAVEYLDVRETSNALLHLKDITTITFASAVTISENNNGFSISNNPAISSVKKVLQQISEPITGAANTTVDIISGEATNIKGLDISSVIESGLTTMLLAGDDSISITQTGTPKSVFQNFVDAANGNDSIVGSDIFDELEGGNGNDTINGAGGDDIIIGGAGNDSLLGGAGNDEIRLDRSPYAQSFEQDTVDGGAGTNDEVFLSYSAHDLAFVRVDATTADLLSKDRSYAARITGVETVHFGDGVTIQFNDSINGFGQTTQALVSQHTGTQLADNLTDFNDNSDEVFLGGAGNDTITTFGGNDLLDGGSGNDSMIGGSGDDTYLVDSATDVVIETQGGGYDEIYTTVANYTISAGAEIEFLRFGGMNELVDITSKTAFSATGNEFGQEILGNAAANTFDGKAGDDHFIGYAGNDTLKGGEGNDGFFASTGDDSISGDAGDDVSYHFLGINAFSSEAQASFSNGTADVDLAYLQTNILSGGNDSFSGGAGSDTAIVFGPESSFTFSKNSSGLLVITKGSESVTLSGDVENVSFVTTTPSNNNVDPFDAVFVNAVNGNVVAAADLLAGAASSNADVLYQRGSGSFNNNSKIFTPTDGYTGSTANLDGLAGNDVLFGTDITPEFLDLNGMSRKFGDNLIGGDGTDSLVGLSGFDYLDGGAGNDTMDGGVGSDLYIVDSIGDVVKGEETFEASEFGNPSANALQVKGAISYVLASGQRVGFLSAGQFDSAAFASGVQNFWTYANTNAANIKGNDFGQTIFGNAAGNKLEGAGGDDQIWGGAGNDTLDGGDGNDWLEGGVGNDSLVGGAGDDSFGGDFGYDGINIVQLSGGKDTIVGGTGNDTLHMRFAEGDYSVIKSDATIVFTNKNDTNNATTIDVTQTNGVEFVMFGSDIGANALISVNDLLAGTASTKDDVLYLRNSGSYNGNTKIFTPTEGYIGSAANLDGLAGNDLLFGSGFSDSLAGGEGKDSLTGLGGNDFLNGGAGDDTLDGGLGIDLYIVDSALDVIKGEEVEDINNTILNLNLANNAVQVNGATSYVLASGQRVGYLTAGQIDVSVFGTDTFNFSNISLTNTNLVNIKGNDFAQLIDGNAAANKLEGLGGDDYIHASAGNDTLDGGAGNDYLGGGRDNDSIFGGIGNDSLSGGSGNDTLDGGEGNDELGGGSGNDSLVGGAGDDKFSADLSEFNSTTSTMDSGGKDSILGGAGNDTVYMQFAETSYNVSKTDTTIILTNKTDANSVTTIDRTSANGVELVSFNNEAVFSLSDLLAGAATSVNDTLFQRASLVGLGPLSIDGLAGNDTITGTEGFGDSLVGGEGKDSLVGRAGNDFLDGGAGDDTLDGGAGLDLYIVDSALDVIKGEEVAEASALANGVPIVNALQVRGATSYVLANGQNVEFLTAGQFDSVAFNSGSSNFWTFSNTNVANIKGNDFAQQIVGNAAANKLEGAGGNDVILGLAGSDTLDGGDGNDSLDGGSGNDSLVGGAGDDVLSGDYGYDGVSSIQGSGGKDTITGGSGTDTVFMQFAESSYTISKTDTTIVLTNKTDANSITTIDRTSANGVENVVFAGSPTRIAIADLLAGAVTTGNDNLFQRASLAGTGGLSIDGLAGNDTITGTDTDVFGDSLAGGDGTDSLVGLAGNDLLNGGAGNDTMNGGVGADLYIVDSVGDVINGEGGDEAPITVNGVNLVDAVQVTGATSYVLANGQKVEYLSAGLFDAVALQTAFNTGSNQIFWTYTNTNAANIKGNEFNQYIDGNAAGNRLEGAGGDDEIWGAAGNDTLDGGDGNDSLDGGSGNDSLVGGAGNDVFNGDLGELNLSTSVMGSGGKDTLVGGTGTDTVFMQFAESSYSVSRTDTTIILTNKTDANSVTTIDRTTANGVENVVFAGNPTPIAIADLLAGAATSGNDTLFQRASLAGTGGLSIDGLAGNDTITGTGEDDTLLGGEGKDSLVGLAGDDYLDGGLGDDTMVGGTGHDRYLIDSAGDVVVEVLEPNELNTGKDRDEDVAVVSTNWTVGASARLEALIAAGELGKKFLNLSTTVAEAKVDITGNAFDESLIGSGAANKLDGGAGNDWLFGSDGADTLIGGSGVDTLSGGVGNDSLSAGSGDDVILFNLDSKLINPENSFTIADSLDRLTGGVDTVDGGDGIDVIAMRGSREDYTIARTTNTDYLITANAAHAGVALKESAIFRNIEGLVFGGEASDFEQLMLAPVVQLSALGVPSDFDDDLRAQNLLERYDRNGGKGNDTIFGSQVGDSLAGGEGNDCLVGFGGNDTLVGGAGNDTLVAIKDVSPTESVLSLDGGADNDTYVVNTINTNRMITIADSGGLSDTIVINQEDADPSFTAYVDGATNTLKFYGKTYTELGVQLSANPFLTVGSGAMETLQLFRYSNLSNSASLLQTVTANIVAATRETATQNWIVKGTDKSDLIFATTGGANIIDGGKGDDIINVNAHTGSIAQGGEGFNTLYVQKGLPVEGTGSLNPEIFDGTSRRIGTLSYAWAVNTVEVHMEAGIGVAYDAKGEEIIAMDDFAGFANIIGGKGNDLIVGDTYDNRLDGGEGKDTLAGGGGFDTLIGGLGDDTYLVDLGNLKTIVSERIAPTAMGEVDGVLTLQGGTDAKSIDTLVLSGFSDVMDLRFGVSDATVTVGVMDGGVVSNRALVDKAIEQISFDTGVGTPAVYLTNWGNIGTKSADFIITKDVGGMGLGGQGDDFLMGGQGQDILLGGLGNDIIRGGAGSDKLIGNAGNDILHVHSGDGDLALGGAGADTFIIKGASSANQGKSQILDFKLNEDFINFDNAAGVTIHAGTAVLSKGVFTDPIQTMVVNLDARGNMTFEADASISVTQVVSLIGIDTQQELSALMDRIVIG